MSKARRSHSALIILVVGIFALWWGIAVMTESATAHSDANSAPVYTDDVYTGGAIALTSSTNNNVVTYSANVALASPCDSLGSGVAERGTSPTHVTVVLTMSSPPSCTAQTASTAPFEVSVSLPRGQMPVFDGVTVNGVIEPVTITNR